MIQMIPSLGKSTHQTLLRSHISAAAVLHKVILTPNYSLTVSLTLVLLWKTVWGVIWLIIAFIFFAAGVIVGLVSFKVCSNHRIPTKPPSNRHLDLFLRIGLSSRTRRKSTNVPSSPWCQRCNELLCFAIGEYSCHVYIHLPSLVGNVRSLFFHLTFPWMA